MAYIFINLIGTLALNQAGILGNAQTPYIRGLFVASIAFGTVYIAGPLYLFNHKIKFYSEDIKFTSTIGIVIFYSLLIGFINSNSYTYILSDLAYLIVGLAIFLLTRFGNIHFDINKNNLIKVSLLTAIAILILEFAFGWPSVSLIIFYFALFLYGSYLGYKKFIFINLIPIILIAINSNRATLMTLGIMIIILVFIMIFKKKFGLLAIFMYSSVLLLILAILTFNSLLNHFAYEILSSPLGMRIYSMMEIFNPNVGGIDFSRDITISQRLYEVTAVTHTLGSNVFYWLFGYGLGGTLDMSGTLDTSVANSALLGAESVHNIHLLHGAMLFRYGLIGLLILIIFFFKLLKISIKTVDSTTMIMSLAAIAIIIYSIPASSFFVTEPLIWFCAAIIITRKRILKPTH
ncbi:hypothetical protein [Jeotgalibacillus proteolyticus]|nr:hypothetical protein [Jeotgalibacillus proteolyticus]